LSINDGLHNHTAVPTLTQSSTLGEMVK